MGNRRLWLLSSHDYDADLGCSRGNAKARLSPLSLEIGEPGTARRESVIKVAARCFVATTLPILLVGCPSHSGAPMISVFGSFVPAWVLCVVLGVVTTIVLRAVFIRVGVDAFLPLRLLVYVSLTVLAAILYWLVGFGGIPG